MKHLKNIKHIVTDNSITVYWKKPEWGNGYYEMFLNGICQGKTNKTYYSFEGLEAAVLYSISINWIAEKKNDASLTVAEFNVETGPGKKRLDVTKAPYNAVGDGNVLNTKAIQQAIDDCGTNEIVYFPAGIYLTGALKLHSDMELYLEENCILQGTAEPEDYLPRIWSRFEGIEQECYSSLINMGDLDHFAGYNCENVMIHGKGIIASGGKRLAEKIITAEKERLKDYLLSLGDKVAECEFPETIPGRVRPRLVNISNSRNISISGVTFKDGASWNVHMIYSDNVTTWNCTFYSKDVWNGDGWDPDSSTNCSIFGCMFYTGDDSIAVKSGKNPEGNKVARPSENIWIFSCSFAFGHGIAIGSEMSGGVKAVDIWDCDLSKSIYGIEIKGTAKRGGYVKNIHVRDCIVPRLLFHSVTYNDDGEAASSEPVFEDCKFNRVQILGEYCNRNQEWIPCDAIELCGFKEAGHRLQNIKLNDIRLGVKGKSGKHTISLQYCENISIKKVSTV